MSKRHDQERKVNLPKGQKNRIADHRTSPAQLQREVISEGLVDQARDIVHDIEVSLTSLERNGMQPLRIVRLDEFLDALRRGEPASVLEHVFDHAVAEPLSALVQALSDQFENYAAELQAHARDAYRSAVVKVQDPFRRMVEAFQRTLSNLDEIVAADEGIRARTHTLLSDANTRAQEGQRYAAAFLVDGRALADLLRTTHRALMNGELSSIDQLGDRTREIETLRDHRELMRRRFEETRTLYDHTARAFHEAEKHVTRWEQQWHRSTVSVSERAALFTEAGIDPDLYFRDRQELFTMPAAEDRQALHRAVPEPFPALEQGVRDDQISRVLDALLEVAVSDGTSKSSGTTPSPSAEKETRLPGGSVQTLRLVSCAYALAKKPWSARAMFLHLEKHGATGGISWAQFVMGVGQAKAKRLIQPSAPPGAGGPEQWTIAEEGKRTVESCRWLANFPEDLATRLRAALESG